jgi:hypothetical protein
MHRGRAASFGGTPSGASELSLRDLADMIVDQLNDGSAERNLALHGGRNRGTNCDAAAGVLPRKLERNPFNPARIRMR